MILFNKEVLTLLRIGLEDETDLSGITALKPRHGVGLEDAKARPSGTIERYSPSSPVAQFISDIANTEPKPVSTSLAVAKRVEAAKGLARDGYKPLMRNRTGENALPDRHTASDTFSPIPSDLGDLGDLGLLLLAALPE